MRLANTASELRSMVPVCAAIGVLDGVHLGHREIIRRIRAQARELNGVSLVITFDRHPNAVVAPARTPPMISTLSQRLRLLEESGADATLVLHFDEALSRVSGEDFIRHLHRDLGQLRSLTVGEEFTFGHRRSGDVALLRKLGTELGFDIDAVGPVEVGDERVSSTLIRELIQAGELDAAAKLLGRRHAIAGPVFSGDQLGRKIGFPTANLDTTGLVLPPFGVYAGRTRVEGKDWKVAMNIGVRPTLNQPQPQLRVEAHLLNFNGDLVGVELEVELLARLRPEMKFTSLEELKAQIAKDVAAIRGLEV
jgi:riboflavin kinase / FMN adenylyltransferase